MFDVQIWQQSRVVALQQLTAILEEHTADEEER